MKLFVPTVSFLVFFLFGTTQLSAGIEKKVKSAPNDAVPNEQYETNVSAADSTAVKQRQSKLDKSDDRDRVRALQKRMIEEGYYEGPVNGIITPETRRAARGFYSDRI